MKLKNTNHVKNVCTFSSIALKFFASFVQDKYYKRFLVRFFCTLKDGELLTHTVQKRQVTVFPNTNKSNTNLMIRDFVSYRYIELGGFFFSNDHFVVINKQKEE